MSILFSGADLRQMINQFLTSDIEANVASNFSIRTNLNSAENTILFYMDTVLDISRRLGLTDISVQPIIGTLSDSQLSFMMRNFFKYSYNNMLNDINTASYDSVSVNDLFNYFVQAESVSNANIPFKHMLETLIKYPQLENTVTPATVFLENNTFGPDPIVSSLNFPVTRLSVGPNPAIFYKYNSFKPAGGLYVNLESKYISIFFLGLSLYSNDSTYGHYLCDAEFPKTIANTIMYGGFSILNMCAVTALLKAYKLVKELDVLVPATGLEHFAKNVIILIEDLIKPSSQAQSYSQVTDYIFILYMTVVNLKALRAKFPNDAAFDAFIVDPRSLTFNNAVALIKAAKAAPVSFNYSTGLQSLVELLQFKTSDIANWFDKDNGYDVYKGRNSANWSNFLFRDFENNQGAFSAETTNIPLFKKLTLNKTKLNNAFIDQATISTNYNSAIALNTSEIKLNDIKVSDLAIRSVVRSACNTQFELLCASPEIPDQLAKTFTQLYRDSA